MGVTRSPKPSVSGGKSDIGIALLEAVVETLFEFISELYCEMVELSPLCVSFRPASLDLTCNK